MTLLRDRNVVARKMHNCDWCGGWIKTGEEYHYYVGVHDGYFQATHMHKDCYDQCRDKAEEYGCDYEFEQYAHDRPTQEVRG